MIYIKLGIFREFKIYNLLFISLNISFYKCLKHIKMANVTNGKFQMNFIFNFLNGSTRY